MLHPSDLILLRRTLSGALLGTVLPGLALLLGGCAGTPAIPPESSAAPRIEHISPQALQQGKAATLNLQVAQWAPGTQLALMSAGPYVTHRLALDSTPTALVARGPQAFLASADGRLSVVDFPAKAHAGRVVGTVALAGPAVQLVFAGERLVALLADGRLQWVEVSEPAAPRVLATQPTVGAVRDLWVDGEAVYVLLAPVAGQSYLQQWLFAEGASPRLARQWALPVAAEAVAVRDLHAWSVGPDGVVALDLSGTTAVAKAFQRTSGTPLDIQLQANLALVADGRGGLVLFDISDPAQLLWRGSYNKRGAIQGFSISAKTPGSPPTSSDNALLALRNGTVMLLGLDNPELPSSGEVFHPDAAPLASTLQDKVALLATRQGLQRVMMTGNGDNAISPEGVNLGGSRRGVIRGDILYVADWFSGLHLYDISNPRQLRHLGNYHTPGSSKGVALLGNYALVGDDDQGLQIIDIEDPRHPSWTAELPPKAMARLGLAYTMKLVGKTLYLADHRGGFHITDLSDIHHPRRLGGYPTPGKAWGIDVKDGVAFVADDRAGLLMFDVSNPAKPEPFAQFNPGGQAEDVALQDGRAYVAFFDQGLYTLDVSDPHQAKVIGHTPIPGNARSIELDDGLLYVASWEAGLQVVDTRGSVVPKIIGSFDTDGATWGVKVKDGFAYLLDWWGGIKVVDLRDPSRPALAGRYHARGTLHQLRTKGNYLYAASGAGGLQVYDIKNPLNPIWAKGLDVAGESRDLWIEDDRAYLAAGDGGVALFDILDPFNSHQIGAIDTPGEAKLVRANNEYLYIADSRAGLLVMDVRDPQRPVEVARYAVQPHDMWLDEKNLWLVTATGLSKWSMAEDGSLHPDVHVSGVFTAVWAGGGRVVTASPAGVITLWRASGPQSLAVQGEFRSDGSVSGLRVDDNTLYLVDPRNGLQAVDIRQPQAPRLTAVYPSTGDYQQVAIARGAAFLAGEAKPASVKLLPTVTVGAKDSEQLNLQLPAELPIGRYHLLAVAPNGQRQLYPNAFAVHFNAVEEKKFGLDAFRRLLKTPLKPPREATTEIPPADTLPQKPQ